MSPLIIRTAKLFVGFVVPNIKSAADFDKLTDTITKRLQALWILYDVTFPEKNKNILKLHVVNCPVVEMAGRLGYRDIGPIICQGDWEVAKDNCDKWDFERQHQIGAGDSYCDHTYKRRTIKA